MVEPGLVLSEEADADLIAIAAYIAEHDGAMRASQTADRIWETMRRLAVMPGMGGRRSYLKRGQCAFPAPPWTIYYEKLPDCDGVKIVRVIDGRRDLPAVFGRKK